jgi:hypothetical protein
LLQPDQLDPAILEELSDAEVFAIEELDKSIGLIDQIITANYTVESLEALWVQVCTGNTDLKLEDRLLLYQDRLIVSDTNNLYIHFIKEAYKQLSTAYPSQNKTIQLLANRYYWKGLAASIEQYIYNCYICKQADVP